MLIRNITINHDAALTWLESTGKNTKLYLEQLCQLLIKLAMIGRTFDSNDIKLKEIQKNSTLIIEFINLIRDASTPLPLGLSPIEMMSNETVKKRVAARAKLKFSTIIDLEKNDKTSFLKKIIDDAQEILGIESQQPNDNNNVKLNDADRLVLSTNQFVMGNFERNSMTSASLSNVIKRPEQANAIAHFDKVKEKNPGIIEQCKDKLMNLELIRPCFISTLIEANQAIKLNNNKI